MSGLGFNVTKREQTSDQPAGTVIDQNLAKGYKVDPTDTNRNITLTVSTGYSQTVPSVVGLAPDSAKSNLETWDLPFLWKEHNSQNLVEMNVILVQFINKV